MAPCLKSNKAGRLDGAYEWRFPSESVDELVSVRVVYSAGKVIRAETVKINIFESEGAAG